MWVKHRVPLGPKLHLRLEALPGPQVLTARPTPEADILSRPSTSPPKTGAVSSSTQTTTNPVAACAQTAAIAPDTHAPATNTSACAAHSAGATLRERAPLTHDTVIGLQLRGIQDTLEPGPGILAGSANRVAALLHVRHDLAAFDLAGTKLGSHLFHPCTFLIAPGHTLCPPCIELPDLLVVELESIPHRHHDFCIYSAARSPFPSFALPGHLSCTEGKDRDQRQSPSLFAFHRSSSLRTT